MGTRSAFLVRQGLEPPLQTQSIDITLREDRSEPCGEAASPMEILEERSPLAAVVLESVQVRIQRIGELACAAAPIERIGRAIEQRPILEHEPIPGGLVSGRTAARQ